MGTDVKRIMGQRRWLLETIADDRLDKDLKLLVLCTAAYITEHRDRGTRARQGEPWLAAVGAMVMPGESAARQRAWIGRVISSDAPRYVPVKRAAGAGCVFVRADGQLCGKKVIREAIDRHPITGEGREVAYCSGHWSHELSWGLEQKAKAWVANGRPEPEPNTGGLLGQYLRFEGSGRWGWSFYYRWAQYPQRRIGSDEPDSGVSVGASGTENEHPEAQAVDSAAIRPILRVVPAGSSDDGSSRP